MDWPRALASVRAGEIIHATAPTGANLICLVEHATRTLLHTRTVTSQLSLSFDRSTGIAHWGSQRAECVIDSVARLPDDIFELLMQIDTRYRSDTGPRDSPEHLAKFRLSPAEIKALIFTGPFYKAHPIT